MMLCRKSELRSTIKMNFITKLKRISFKKRACISDLLKIFTCFQIQIWDRAARSSRLLCKWWFFYYSIVFIKITFNAVIRNCGLNNSQRYSGQFNFMRLRCFLLFEFFPKWILMLNHNKTQVNDRLLFVRFSHSRRNLMILMF